jgi:serine phosphatase RsbU (regulator of sigma subunit)
MLRDGGNPVSGATVTFCPAFEGSGLQCLSVLVTGPNAVLSSACSFFEMLGSTSTVLGIFKKWDCDLGECQLEPGDTLALYTDGITESFNAAGDEFGESRLLEALQRHRALAPLPALTSIVDEVTRFSPHEQHDDITLILAHCKPV